MFSQMISKISERRHGRLEQRAGIIAAPAGAKSWHRVELAWLRKHDYPPPRQAQHALLASRRRGDRQHRLSAFEGYAELRYSCNGENVVQRINYRYTPTNFGGRRMWFECPNCHRACSVLYGGRRFYCRKCWRLTYASQYEVWWERARARQKRSGPNLASQGSSISTAPMIFRKSRSGCDGTHTGGCRPRTASSCAPTKMDFAPSPWPSSGGMDRRAGWRDAKQQNATGIRTGYRSPSRRISLLAVYVDMIEHDDLDGIFDLMRHAGIVLRPNPTTAILRHYWLGFDRGYDVPCAIEDFASWPPIVARCEELRRKQRARPVGRATRQ